MSRKYQKVYANLACGVVMLSMSLPAAAIDLGGVSIGGNDRGGVSASVGGHLDLPWFWMPTGHDRAGMSKAGREA